MRRFLAVAVLLLGCDGEGDRSTDAHWASATAHVEGSFVVVDVHMLSSEGTFALLVEPNDAFYAEPGKSYARRFPAAKLGGPGPHVLTLGDERRRMPPIKIPFDIPKTALAPYFGIAKCESDTAGINTQVVVDSAPPIDCYTTPGAPKIKPTITAPPNAKFTLGTGTNAQDYTVPPSGEYQVTLDLYAPILDETLDDALASGDGNPFVLPYKLTSGGTEIGGKISISTQFGQRAKLATNWLREIAAGKVDRPAFTPTPAGQRATTIVLPVFGDARTSDHRGTLRTLGYLALEKVAARTEHGTCELKDHDKGSVTAKRILVSGAYDLIRAADGKVVAHKVFAPKDPEECPFIAFITPDKPEVEIRPDGADVDAWVDSLATAKLD